MARKTDVFEEGVFCALPSRAKDDRAAEPGGFHAERKEHVMAGPAPLPK